MFVIGLISGTSVDGIDAALVEITGYGYSLTTKLLAGATYPYPPALRETILAVCGGASLTIAELAELDDAIAHQFAHAARDIQTDRPKADLIGSHGQTVFHRPPLSTTSNDLLPTDLGYTLQLGRGAAIAHLTGIATVSNFRVADIAAGGQGAPLVSAVDACLLAHPTHDRCVQNIGGIGNVTYLPAKPQQGQSQHVRGWDTGPGNVLIDLAVQHLSQGQYRYDADGAWAASGTPCQELIAQWLTQDFFHQPPPKSTGRELFSPAYLEKCLVDAQPRHLSDADVLATLTEFTVMSIVDSYRRFLPQLPAEILLCGGGSKNLYLKQRLQTHLQETSVLTTDDVGMSADFKEAIAFAVLAYWRQQEIPGNLPAVTGATRAVLLGEIYQVAQASS